MRRSIPAPVRVLEFRKHLMGTLSALDVPTLNLGQCRPYWTQCAGVASYNAAGLAVSGGVDSMALAYLCRQLQTAEPLKYAFTAFVVDHSARINSSSESLAVVARLRDIGICAKILRLEWASTQNPLELSNFESEARRLRYRALGEACKTAKITSLLVGHHCDDQSETVMMRILDGRMGRGLMGMKAYAQLPECSDLFGITTPISQARFTSMSASTSTPASGCTISEPLIGVHIGRPLLAFSKQDLVLTCEDGRVPWVEDATNQDRGLTLRNTIRYLFDTQELPRALCTSSLLSLSAKKRQYFRKRDQHIDRFLSYLEQCELDARAGRLSFRLPSLENIVSQDSSLSLTLQDCAKVVEAIADQVCPSAVISKRAAIQIARKLLPNFCQQRHSSSSTKVPSHSFTGGHLLWSWQTGFDGTFAYWTVSRQPPAKVESEACRMWVPVLHSTDTSAGFHLFDGRFWIRVSNKYSDQRESPVQVRHLVPDDIPIFENALDGHGSKRFCRRMLKEAAPGSIRWTLPIITDAFGELLAIPSLSLVTPSARMRFVFCTKFKFA